MQESNQAKLSSDGLKNNGFIEDSSSGAVSILKSEKARFSFLRKQRRKGGGSLVQLDAHAVGEPRAAAPEGDPQVGPALGKRQSQPHAA